MNKIIGFITVLALSFLTIIPLFSNGFFPMHDDTQVARVFEMGKMLKLGVLPVRWVSDLGYGYGYPIFNFYAPLAYYIGGFFNVLGFDALLSTKLMIAFAMLGAGVAMYLLAGEFFGILGGVLAGILYAYAPYHALNLYVRGDVAELYAYIFLPIIFYGLWKVSHERKWRYVATGALGFAGLILSHNLTAFMAAPFIAAFGLILLHRARYKRIVFENISFTALLGVLLSAFYWLPALLQMGSTNVLSQVGGGADYKDHFVCLPQLWESLWGFGGSVGGCVDGLSFRLGKAHVIFALLSVVLFFIFWQKEKEKREVVLFSLFGAIVSILMMLDFSKPVWDGIPPLAFLQYPWRYLMLASFFMSLISGYGMFVQKNKKIMFTMLGICIGIIFFVNLKLFAPQAIVTRSASDYTSVYALKWTASKISDEYLPKDFKKPKSYDEVNLKSPIEFLKTPVEEIANLVSIAGVVMVIAGIIYSRKRKK